MSKKEDIEYLPCCYGEPNEMCSASHEETDGDCKYLGECMTIFTNDLTYKEKEKERVV